MDPPSNRWFCEHIEEAQAAQMVTLELGCSNLLKGRVTHKKMNGESHCLCGEVVVLPKELAKRKEFCHVLNAPEFLVHCPGFLKRGHGSLVKCKRL